VNGPVVVTNSGTGPLSVTINGPKHHPPFTVDSNSFPVQPSSSVTVTVTFAPTKKGKTKDQLSFTSDDPTHKKPIKVKLKGNSK
jgi:Abnormal spindle-like microcephaly-assoc'd, ASPM-SPD-2-Hydin